MKRFFTYTSPYRTGISYDLSVLEYILPIILFLIVAYLLFRYREVFRSNKKIDQMTRIIGGIVFLIVYSSHFILRFTIYGWDTIILPFHLCAISMFFAILLLFTKNKTFYTFVLYTGLLGGFISYLSPVIGYDSSFYRYYQFYIAHALLMLTPLYFMFVHGYYPTKKDTINSYIILQVFIVFMGFFNYYTNSDFMFVFVDPSKIDKFPLIRLLGGIPFYILPGEILVTLAFYGLYKASQAIQQEAIRRSIIAYQG